MRLAVAVVLALALAACQQKDALDSRPIIEAPVQTELEVPAADAAVSAIDSGPAKTLQPLDLTVPADLLQESADQPQITESRLLPDLFDAADNNKRTRISGNLITDEDNPSGMNMDMIKGAEVTIKADID